LKVTGEVGNPSQRMPLRLAIVQEFSVGLIVYEKREVRTRDACNGFAHGIFGIICRRNGGCTPVAFDGPAESDLNRGLYLEALGSTLALVLGEPSVLGGPYRKRPIFD